MPSELVTRPTWVEVSRTALQHNYATIRDYVAPEAVVCAVVKANAYGHGAIECALAFQQEGAKWFGVSTPEEGVKLRQAGVRGRVLLMSGFWRGAEELVIQHDLTPVIWDQEHVERLERAAEKLDKAPQSVPVHLKIDTGMTRLGISQDDLPRMVATLQSAKFVMLEGVCTHLASSEIVDAPDVDAQLVRFDDACLTITESGLSPSPLYFHLANSAAIATRDRTRKNMVRPGLSLYGYFLPFTSVIPGVAEHGVDLPVVPALTWKTRIITARDVDARTRVGYNGAFITQAPSRLAVLPVGYADGYSRQLGNRGRVLVRGDYANVVGNVTMDMTTIDVTGMPGVAVGDEVVLIGQQGEKKVTAWELASHMQTIPYEVLCGISARVPRRYVD
jgi:alanine racemase